MEQEDIIKAFAALGKVMKALGNNQDWSDYTLGVNRSEYTDLQQVILKQFSYNGWFTKENVRESLLGISTWLDENQLTAWGKKYGYQSTPRRVAIVMAGNIPLVGFHDVMCVLISGNTAVCKLSSDDKTLLPALAGVLFQLNPDLQERIVFSVGKLTNIEAVIATGSDNSLKYFEQYFGKYPHIFRKNRTSLAVLKGSESQEELEKLGKDIFMYFGLGCRNVSHLIIPRNFDLNRFFEGIVVYGEVINNNKYGNNYDYNRAIYLMNQHKLLDNNFVLLKEDKSLFSPLAVIHYHYYDCEKEIQEYIDLNSTDIQVVVGEEGQPFGTSQRPGISDYADKIDTMKWLFSF